MEKAPDALRTISEVSEAIGTAAHVLRFWESKFPQIKPIKRAGGRRYYRPSDVALLAGIKQLLHEDGLTVRGAQKILREQGVLHVARLALASPPTEPLKTEIIAADAEAPMMLDVPHDANDCAPQITVGQVVALPQRRRNPARALTTSAPPAQPDLFQTLAPQPAHMDVRAAIQSARHLPLALLRAAPKVRHALAANGALRQIFNDLIRLHDKSNAQATDESRKP
jgi:resuscitation-promoting factor RpfA